MIPVNANGTAFASSLERGIDRKKRAAASAVETCGAMSHRISAILLLLVFPLFESVAQERIGRSARIDCAEGACSSSEQIIRGQAEIQSIPDAERNVLAQLAREASAEESKDALLEQLRLGNGDVTLSFELSERPFDFGRFRSGDESRQDLIEERRLQVEESQAHFAQAVERLGGAVLHRSWAVNKVIARIPRAAVPELLSSPSVFAASLSKGTTEFLTNGAQRRIYSKVNFPYVFGEHDAETGNGTVPGEPVLIAVIDQGDLNTTHVGWRDGVSGSQLRVLETDFCKDWSSFPWWSDFTCKGTANGPNYGHGNSVTSLIGLSIQQGQDPEYPGVDTSIQRTYSGLAREAEFVYYRIPGDGDGAASTDVAIEDAIQRGVDIINLSVAFYTGVFPEASYCNGLYDVAGLRPEIRAATEAGILIVGSAGNEGNLHNCSNTCTVMFPANQTHVMAIAATAGSNPEANGLATFSSCGKVLSPASDGSNWWHPMIDAVTFGSVVGHNDNSLNSGFDSYSTSTFEGTSASAPIATSIAALTKQWMYNHGWSEFDDPYAIRLNMLLSANQRTIAPGASVPSHDSTNVGWHLGYGALTYHYFSYPYTSQLGSVGGWGIHKLTFKSPKTVSWSIGGAGPASHSITGWKIIALADADS